jgi:hypothetical protein
MIGYVMAMLVTMMGVCLWIFVAKARRQHQELRDHERRCKSIVRLVGLDGRCNMVTRRYYRMRRRPGQNCESWWNWCYRFDIVDVCESKPRHANIVFTNTKLFTADELLWRLIWDHSQFIEIEWLSELVYSTRVQTTLDCAEMRSGHVLQH